MTNQENEKKIREVQESKRILYPDLKEAFQKKERTFKSYVDLNENWLKLKKGWELLDREEKLLSFGITKNKTNKNKTNKYIKEAKENALKSLNSLPLEIRKQVLANFNI